MFAECVTLLLRFIIYHSVVGAIQVGKHAAAAAATSHDLNKSVPNKVGFCWWLRRGASRAKSDRLLSPESPPPNATANVISRSGCCATDTNHVLLLVVCWERCADPWTKINEIIFFALLNLSLSISQQLNIDNLNMTLFTISTHLKRHLNPFHDIEQEI